MAVTPEDVKRIAALARLRLDEREVAEMSAQLSSILEHMKALRQVEVEGIEPLADVTDPSAPLREDGGAPDSLHLGPAGIAPAVGGAVLRGTAAGGAGCRTGWQDGRVTTILTRRLAEIADGLRRAEWTPTAPVEEAESALAAADAGSEPIRAFLSTDSPCASCLPRGLRASASSTSFPAAMSRCSPPRALADYYEEVARHGADPREAAS